MLKCNQIEIYEIYLESWITMTHRSHLLIVALFSSFIFIACDSEGLEDISSNQNLTEMTEIALSEETADETVLISETTSAGESTAQEDANHLEEITEATTKEAATLAETEEATAEVAESNQIVKEINPILQVALEELLAVTELDKEAYTYTFEQTAEYIQVEVREKSEEAASLEGIYRYMMDTGEIFYSDYLTGDFVPYP